MVKIFRGFDKYIRMSEKRVNKSFKFVSKNLSRVMRVFQTNETKSIYLLFAVILTSEHLITAQMFLLDRKLLPFYLSQKDGYFKAWFPLGFY